MSDSFKWGTWYPIETAPKDGEEIFLFSPAREWQGMACEARRTQGKWATYEHGKYLGDCGGECRCPEYDDPPEPGWETFDGGFLPELPPTHWMPLPPSPEELEAKPSLRAAVIKAADTQASCDWKQHPEARAIYDTLCELLGENPE